MQIIYYKYVIFLHFSAFFGIFSNFIGLYNLISAFVISL